MALFIKLKWCVVYLWQLPQHLLALAIWSIIKKLNKIKSVDGKWENGWVIWVDIKEFAVSLGKYVFIDIRYTQITLLHEFGHSKQSLKWGPLYLITVGIPSAIFNNLWDRLFHKHWSYEDRVKWYYNRYPEKQADRLAGIIRDYSKRCSE